MEERDIDNISNIELKFNNNLMENTKKLSDYNIIDNKHLIYLIFNVQKSSKFSSKDNISHFVSIPKSTIKSESKQVKQVNQSERADKQGMSDAEKEHIFFTIITWICAFGYCVIDIILIIFVINLSDNDPCYNESLGN